MKISITILLICISTISALAQSQVDFKKFNVDIFDIMVELSGHFYDSCESKLYTLKIEVDTTKKISFFVSDSVDSLYKIEFIEQVRQIDHDSFFAYLKNHNLQSAVFLKSLSFINRSSKCRNQLYSESQVKNHLIFNGKQFTGIGIWMEPETLSKGPSFH